MRVSLGWLSGCLLLSGASAIVYEIAWLRLLALTLGNTAYATSCILAIFLGGLALGAYLAGRWMDRREKISLAVYGFVECSIGIVAPLTTVILRQSPALLSPVLRAVPGDDWVMRTLLNAVLSSLLLLIPTVLMGATLPIIIKYVQRVHRQSEWFSWLYGMNTLGAVLGSFSAGFLGFAYLGISVTTVAAGVVNLAVGMACIKMSRDEPLIPQPAEERSATEPATEPLSPKGATILAVLCFVTGFTAVSYEVLWTRLLRFYTGSLTYAFSVMLGTFLLGLAAGSFYFEKRLLTKDKTNDERFFRFANLQFLSCIASAGSLIAVPIATVIRNNLPGAFPMENPWPMLGQLAVISFAVMFVPTVIMGTLFPLLGTIAASTDTKAAQAIGRTYAINTIGCVLGSLITGLVLIPQIGSYTAFQLSVLFGALAAGLSALASSSISKAKKRALTVLPLVFAIGFLALVHIPFTNFLTVIDGRVLKTAEDAIGSEMVLDFPKADTRVLLFNGSSLATTAMPSRRYMRLLGHLPALVGDRPEQAMVACFGTGTTSGAIALHPEIQRVKVVELSSMVLQSGDLFASSNQNVLHSPKVVPTVTDARNFLLIADDKFDVITFEPPPPCDSGIVNLYTTNFYKLVSKHLRPGGIMCQWVPQHEVSTQLWKMQCKSAMEIFPYVSVWLPNSGEALLLCSDHPPKYDLQEINRRIHENPAVAASLAEVGINDAADLLATFVVDGPTLDHFVGNVPALTDDRPALEFFHPYLGQALSDIDLFNLSGQDKKPFEQDPAVQKARKALVLTMSPGDQLKNLAQAIDLEPDNRWFQWLMRSTSKN